MSELHEGIDKVSAGVRAMSRKASLTQPAPLCSKSINLAAMRASLYSWLTDDGESRDQIAHCFDLMEAGLGQINRPA